MNLRVKHWIYGIFCLLVAIIAIGPELHAASNAHPKKAVVESQVKEKPTQEKEIDNSESHMRTPIDWHKSSETVPYPDLNKVKDFWIKVDLKNNRTYLYDGSKVIYTMYSTGGIYKKDPKTGKLKSVTPTGTFYAQQERGDSFFNQSLKEGANYYVSGRIMENTCSIVFRLKQTENIMNKKLLNLEKHRVLTGVFGFQCQTHNGWKRICQSVLRLRLLANCVTLKS